MKNLIERLNLSTSGDNAPLRSTRTEDLEEDFHAMVKRHCYENEAMDNLPDPLIEPLADLIESHLLDNGIVWFWFDIQ